MATAKRLYLYTVTLIGLVLLIGGAVSLLRIVVNRIGVGPQGTTTSSANLDTLSISAAFGIVGLVVWATHWAMIEHMVRPARPAATALPDPGAPERQSIVRSVFFFVVLYFALTYCLELLDDLAGRTVADVLAPASSMNVLGLLGFGDDWEVSLVAVLLVVWAYHAWVRVRDVRQGPVIAGAAAWISRFYLYYLALGALLIVLENIGSIVSTVAAQWASVPDVPTLSTSFDVTVPTLAGAASDWERPLIMAAVGIAIFGIAWLLHWTYAEHLRTGGSAQAHLERASKVRLAYLMSVVFVGALVVVIGIGSGLGALIEQALNVPSTLPLWYLVLVPPATSVPFLVAWWWHRRRGFAESDGHAEGVSARRIAGYVVALAGIAALASGADQILSTVFGQWWASIGSQYFDSITDNVWKVSLSGGLGLALTGLLLWFWPWLSAQRRRAATAPDCQSELDASSRNYYLYFLAGVSVAVLATDMVVILYRYLRLGFGLNEAALGAEVSGAIAASLVAAAVLAYHGLVLWRDRMPLPPAAPAVEVPAPPAGGDVPPVVDEPPVPPVPAEADVPPGPVMPAPPVPPVADVPPAGEVPPAAEGGSSGSGHSAG